MAGAGPVTEHSESEGEVGPMEEFLERESNETMMDYEWPACAKKVATWNSDTAKKEVAAAGGFSVRGATLHLPRAAVQLPAIIWIALPSASLTVCARKHTLDQALGRTFVYAGHGKDNDSDRIFVVKMLGLQHGKGPLGNVMVRDVEIMGSFTALPPTMALVDTPGNVNSKKHGSNANATKSCPLGPQSTCADAHHVTRGRGGEGLGDANEEYARMQEALVDAEAVIAVGGPKNLDADQPAQ